MYTRIIAARRIGRAWSTIFPLVAVLLLRQQLGGAFAPSLSPVRKRPSTSVRSDLASRARRPALGAGQTTSSLQAEKQQEGETEYIDDCFGLISLSSLVVARDAVFCATFVALSAVALVATRANQIQLEDVTAERRCRAVPAVVAAATLLLAPVVEILVTPYYTQELNDKARLLELAVVAVSIAYGFVSKVDDEEAS